MQISSSRRPHPQHGDLWLVDLGGLGQPGGPVGHEQGGRRPALVLSADDFNATAAGLAIVAPLTTRFRGIRTHVTVAPPDGNLARISYVLCEQVRAVSLERLERLVGSISPQVLHDVQYVIRRLLVL
jgi:mRNA interferase MazF